MESNYTPGPWQMIGPSVEHVIEGVHYYAGDYAIVHKGQIIAEVFSRTDDEHTEPAEANARLIAAAPGLVKILDTIATIPLPGEAGALRLTGSDAEGMIRMARRGLAAMKGECDGTGQ
jgi:hypothetical protein